MTAKYPHETGSAEDCESCAVVPATTHSRNPEYSGYALCDECAHEYDSRARGPGHTRCERCAWVISRDSLRPRESIAGEAGQMSYQCPGCDAEGEGPNTFLIDGDHWCARKHAGAGGVVEEPCEHVGVDGQCGPLPR